MAENEPGRVERAIKLFNSGCNCAQATLCAFCDDIGIDEKLLLRVASDFGGGISGTRETCGAITGMLMALGFLRGYDDVTDTEHKHRLYDEGRALIEDFTAEFGTLTCAELTRDVAPRFRMAPHPLVSDPMCRPCTAFVAYAVSILEKNIKEAGVIHRDQRNR